MYEIERTEETIRRAGRHPLIQIIEVTEDKIKYEVEEGEWCWKADVSGSVVGSGVKEHAYKNEVGRLTESFCGNLSIPITMITDERNEARKIKVGGRETVQCSKCNRKI